MVTNTGKKCELNPENQKKRTIKLKHINGETRVAVTKSGARKILV